MLANFAQKNTIIDQQKNIEFSNFVAQFNQLGLYRTLIKPNLDSSKLRQIDQQLSLKKYAKKNFEARRSHMFNIQLNPFTHQFTSPNQYSPRNRRIVTDIAKDEQKNKIPKQDENDKIKDKIKDIIDQLQKYRQNKEDIRQKMSKPLQEIIKEKKKLTNFFQSSTSLKNDFKKKRKQNENQIIQSIIKQNHTKKNIYFEKTIDLENIIMIKQQKSKLQEKKIQNIFHFLNKKQIGKIIDQSTLDSLYFSHNITKDPNQKRRTNTYRDISYMSRKLIIQRQINEDKSSYLTVSETNPILDEPSIDLIMSISAGRIKFHQLRQILQQDLKLTSKKQYEVTTTSLFVNQINYPQNCQNISTIKKQLLQNKIQAQIFHALPLEKIQIKYKKNLAIKLDKIKESIQQEKKLLLLKVNDKKLMEKIENTRLKLFEGMLNTGIAGNGNIDIERSIRHKKMFKNRTEDIHLKSLIEAFKAEKQLKISNSKSKSQSKSKSKSKKNTKIEQKVQYSTSQLKFNSLKRKFNSKSPIKYSTSKK